MAKSTIYSRGYLMTTLEQQIEQKKDELKRLQEKKHNIETSEKVVIGGMMLSMARKNPQMAQNVLNWIATEVNRDTDKKRLENVISELKKVVEAQESNLRIDQTQQGNQQAYHSSNH